jgi:hypothetical protein
MSSSEISMKSDLRKRISIQLILVVFAFRFVTEQCCAEASTQNSFSITKCNLFQFYPIAIENYLSNIITIYCALSNDKSVLDILQRRLCKVEIGSKEGNGFSIKFD